MLGLAAYRATLCPVCGGLKDECQGPGAEFRFRGAPPIRCHRRTAISRQQEEFTKGSNSGHLEALMWPVVEQG